jgi:hypothetical protein
MFQTAQLLPEGSREDLTGKLVCYGRSVVNLEWPRMEAGSQGTSINPWTVALFRSLQSIEPVSNSEQSAYDTWLAHWDEAAEARRDRLHSAEGIIPLPVWVTLFFSAGIVLIFMIFFADSAERAIVQGLLMGCVTAVIVATLLTLAALNQPYSRDPGDLRPVAMERSLVTLREASQALGLQDPIPCDAAGRPA